MFLSVAPIQPMTAKKGNSGRYKNQKRGSPGEFSALLQGMVSGYSRGSRQDGFTQSNPQKHTDFKEETMTEIGRLIQEVNGLLTAKLL